MKEETLQPHINARGHICSSTDVNPWRISVTLSSSRTSRGKTEDDQRKRKSLSKREDRTEKKRKIAPVFWYQARAIWQDDLLLWYLFLLRPLNDGRFTRAEVGSLINGQREINRIDLADNRYQRWRCRSCNCYTPANFYNRIISISRRTSLRVSCVSSRIKLFCAFAIYTNLVANTVTLKSGISYFTLEKEINSFYIILIIIHILSV